MKDLLGSVNPVWIGPLVGLVGILLAIAFYTLGRRARLKRPTWAIRSTNVVRGFVSRLPGLEISFQSQKVETLTISRVVFWNRGVLTIDGSDIAPADPLRVAAVGGARLLNVQLVQVNNDPSRFAVAPLPDLSAALLTFDFLDCGHGGVVQVIHTGVSSDDVRLGGTIKGVGTPQKRMVRGHRLPLPTSAEFDRRLKPQTRRRISIACDLLVALTIVTVIGFLIGQLLDSPMTALRDAWHAFEKNRPVLHRAVTLAGIAIGYLVVIITLNRLATFRAPMLPGGLMAFADDPISPEPSRRGASSSV